MVGFIYRLVNFIFALNSLFIVLTNDIARIESPPMSQKLSLIPILSSSTDKISDQIFTNFLSSLLLGATYSTPVFIFSPGSGNAFLSNLPFAVNGNSSILTKYEGIIYPGNCFDKYSLNSDTNISFSETIYAHKYLLPCLSSLSTTIASFINSLLFNLLSISPISILNPLIFT
ncbi:hypothetical protein CLBEIC_55710 [Clostridium beijerinckii]|nr:hypothetical protein CLBEIC_55710 [Clostridium beijerinckii]